MRKLIVFLYFVFLFKLAFAQSLPSIPSFRDLTGIEPAAGTAEQQVAQIPDMPSLESENEDDLPGDLDLPVTDNTVNVLPSQPDTSVQIDIEAPALDVSSPAKIETPASDVATPGLPDEFEAPALPPTADTGSTAPVSNAEVKDIPTLPDQDTSKNVATTTTEQKPAGTGSVMDEIISEDAARSQFPETPDLNYEKNKKALQGEKAEVEAPVLTPQDREKEVDNLLDQVFDKGKTPEQLAAEKAQEEADADAAEKEKNAKQDDSPLLEKVVDVNEEPIQPIDELQTDDNEQMDLTDLPASMKDSASPSPLNSPLNQTASRAAYTSNTYSEQQLSEMLVKAAMMGNKNTVIELIHSGRSPNSQNVYGETPLMGAVYSGHNQLVEILLSEGADANISDNKGNSSLLVAAAKNNLQAVQQLIRGGADIDLANNASDTALLVATLNNNKEVADVLVRQGADINKSNADGMTSLHIAAYNGNADMVRYLLSVGANPNVVARGGLKPQNLTKNAEVAQLIGSYVDNQQKVAEANRIANEIKEQTSPYAQQKTSSDSQYAMFPTAYVDPQPEQQPTQLPQSNWWAATNTPTNNSQSNNKNIEQISHAEVQTADYSGYDNYQMPASMAYKKAAAQQQTNIPVVQYQSSPVPNEKKWTKLTVDQANLTPTPALIPVSQPKVQQTAIPNQQVIAEPVVQQSAPVRAVYDANGNLVNTNVVAPTSVVATAPQAQPIVSAKPASMASFSREVAVNTYIPPTISVPQQVKQQPAAIMPAKAQYNLPQGPINNNININVPRYADLDPAKQAVWDMKLAQWVKEGVTINAKSEGEKVYWMKQQKVLQAVYQEQFGSKVESVKKRMSSTGINFTPAPENYSAIQVISRPVKLSSSVPSFKTSSTSADNYLSTYTAAN